jgi:hypothetical protein
MIFVIPVKWFWVMAIFERMKPTGTASYTIAYKWLSYCVVLAAAYYWLMTLGLVFFGDKVAAAIPRQTLAYRSFCRQNWRLFAVTKVYNRQMNLIVRDKQNPAKADTTDMVQYLLTEKRAYAPFNNYEDALDRILYLEMNNVIVLMNHYKRGLTKQFPGKPAAFYMQEAAAQVEADTLHRQNIGNLVAFGKYILQKKGLGTAGKEYQLSIVRKFIAPAKPPHPRAPGSDEEIIFTSAYKSF